MCYACLHVAFEDETCTCRRKILIISILRLGESEKKTDYRYVRRSLGFSSYYWVIGCTFPLRRLKSRRSLRSPQISIDGAYWLAVRASRTLNREKRKDNSRRSYTPDLHSATKSIIGEAIIRGVAKAAYLITETYVEGRTSKKSESFVLWRAIENLMTLRRNRITKRHT